MGTEALWIPAVIAAAGAGVQAHNTYQTAKRTDKTAAAGIRNQAERQRLADQRTNQQISTIEGSSPEEEQSQSLNQYLTQLRSSRANATGGAPVPGGSDRFQADTEAAGADIANYGQRAAGQLSRIAAPQEQRAREGREFGRTATDIGGIQREASGDAFLNNLRLRGIQRNPWLDIAGQTAQGVAQGMAMNAAPMAGGAPSVTPAQIEAVPTASRRTLLGFGA